MQTVLGSNGQIGHEIADEIYRHYTKDIRLVGRKPKKIHDTDELVAADLMNYEDTLRAISGSDIVYFAVGMPADSAMWEERFPIMLDNVIKACETTNSKLAFFDNTYMYDKNADAQVENSRFHPVGRKSTVRGHMAQQLLEAMNNHKLTTLIARAPEFYGPDKTQSFTNSLVFNRIKAGKRAFIPVSDKVLRTLIWTPDASRAIVLLANTPDAYGQTWHLPTDRSVTYETIITIAENSLNKTINYTVLPMWVFKIASRFSQPVKELMELLPRYRYDNIFKSNKFKQRFPDFKVTTFEEGISKVLND
ncbi:NAD-dependent epimerase/dehydratase family protein [Staphylococcus simiae]|uniref:NAD-dependent epimerase/dehydratase domain-containing protein n=1 Tax=Staphylococcus simiae CCM 7213 = CCUG 51256 TaxID=911238 RepID=G5JHZ1_9STAP|nr:NAD-dependent epimerase/dehydratase family protein [Staphylococcus simiae]EHJ08184.1 hypothetical protein SS7213T_05366 [Staphylococcus simiae CCM 7213 = CCUG 51256]PNZ14284.1 NAD-dependent dehydratase [Staphylococcus simiae]SNV81673.1 NAD dependent epimerase/dehydratase family [Staphylococcus simiae]